MFRVTVTNRIHKCISSKIQHLEYKIAVCDYWFEKSNDWWWILQKKTCKEEIEQLNSRIFEYTNSLWCNSLHFVMDLYIQNRSIECIMFETLNNPQTYLFPTEYVDTLFIDLKDVLQSFDSYAIELIKKISNHEPEDFIYHAYNYKYLLHSFSLREDCAFVDINMILIEIVDIINSLKNTISDNDFDFQIKQFQDIIDEIEHIHNIINIQDTEVEKDQEEVEDDVNDMPNDFPKKENYVTIHDISDFQVPIIDNDDFIIRYNNPQIIKVVSFVLEKKILNPVYFILYCLNEFALCQNINFVIRAMLDFDF